MKSKLIVLGILVTVGLIFAAPQGVQADSWATVSIDQVGQDYARSIIIITDTGGVFTHQWCILHPNNKKEMLAVALTAQSQGKNLVVQIDDDGKTINRIRISNE